MARKSASLPTEALIALHAVMLKIRASETALAKLFADGEIPGFIHLSLGQEAAAAGVCAALDARDTLATTHRGHGHVIARGIDLAAFFKELLGRAGGRCGGRSGSMHVADMSLGVLGANGIVGASVPLALGSALSHRTRRTGGVAVAFFGDGAMAEGALHEAMNMAALWALPIVFACENNGWSEFSPTARQFRGSLSGMASTFGIEHRAVDGNDVEQTALAARAAVGHARATGPFVLECMTTRVRGHYEGDPQKYRTEEEKKAVAGKDPIAISRALLARDGVSVDVVEAMAAEADAAVAAAVAAAGADALPDFAAALADVYTPVAAGRGR